ncbi:putative type-b cytochrome [Sesbania bispinosa]|nr:putative type-b cytochrome [Sesbania bispinosa]
MANPMEYISITPTKVIIVFGWIQKPRPINLSAAYCIFACWVNRFSTIIFYKLGLKKVLLCTTTNGAEY